MNEDLRHMGNNHRSLWAIRHQNHEVTSNSKQVLSKRRLFLAEIDAHLCTWHKRNQKI